MITNKSKLWKFVSNLFVSIDQLGNVIAGGNPDNTISARVGYYNHYHKKYLDKGSVPWYWRLFQKVIDFTFYPADGPKHCHEAYHNDAGEIFDNRVTNILIAIASFAIILPSCIVISLILYPLFFLGIIKQRKIKRDENLIKRFDTGTRLLKGVNQEIEEYGLDFNLTEVKKQFSKVKNQVRVIESKFPKPKRVIPK